MGLDGSIWPWYTLFQSLRTSTGKNALFFRYVTAYTRQAMRQTFLTSGSRDGGERWAPLKPKTIQSKRRKGYAQPEMPLIARGRMMNALGSFYDWNSVTMYNKQFYHGYHESGSSTLPRRQSLWWSNKDVDKLARMYRDSMLGRLRIK